MHKHSTACMSPEAAVYFADFLHISVPHKYDARLVTNCTQRAAIRLPAEASTNAVTHHIVTVDVQCNYDLRAITGIFSQHIIHSADQNDAN